MTALLREGATPRSGQILGDYASTEGLYVDCCGLIRRILKEMRVCMCVYIYERM